MTNKRAAIYARISRDMQKQGLGVARQMTDCRAYAAANGLEVVAELVDNDISASGLKKRPSYLELRELMEARGVDVVIVWSMDRLHRSMAELVDFIALSNSSGVGMVSVTGSAIDLSTAEGRFQAHIFGAVAAAEREKTQERIKRKALSLAQAGAWPAKRVYGYLASGEVVEEEAEIIRELAARVLDGEGLNEVSRDLESRGIGTLNSATWRASTVRTLLYSARIAGHREHHGVIVARDCWPAILDQESHTLLRAKLAPGQSGKKRGGPRKYLLTGLLTCSLCGTGLVRGLAGKSRVPNYRCPKNQGTKACGRLSINFDSTEEFLTEALFAAHDRLADATPDGQGPSLAEWTEARDRIEERRRRANLAMSEGVIEIDEWIEIRASFDRQIAELGEPQMQTTRPRVTGAELRAAWPTMPTPIRRQLMEKAFEKVVVQPRRIVTGRKVFDPGRLEPVWKI
ncbi:recombinase family protein [Glutamicibacter sp. NPDC087583]|uniref:recombinase family protein n=1 Tax=Glutamicibacter sp. NPDC087583 TaxID=3363995 RepID=UPI0037F4505A